MKFLYKFKWQNFVFLIIVLSVSYFNINAILNFIKENSNQLVLVTNVIIGLIGLTVLYIYRKQKADEKKDAANIILLEIQNAEKLLKQSKNQLYKPIPELLNTLVMEQESWNRYKYLFVADLDKIQWSAITDFYSSCKKFDEAVRLNNSFFEKNEIQIRVQLTQQRAECIKEYLPKIKNVSGSKKESIFAEMDKNIKLFFDTYLSHGLLYNPQRPIDDAKDAIVSLDMDLSLSSVGKKLEEIVKS